ncbi:multicopper oxidase domain-containing protein [Volucribacter amazonae]|uniref:Cell division protein FtsP n=1 Tax=Volucribacter amazonae TaxID=256731 RepID=A0A9X4SHJ1_9PAST|nr:multicopper oxidase domain-containing protein [Volucribacter amazonae]MDG6894687.1 cell division protein FtsQ [Volucribacter amazonae]
MKAITRRQLLKTGLYSTALLGLPQRVWATERPPLFIPPLLESRRGRPLYLTLESVRKSLIDDKSTEVWGFNGLYLGPTIRVKRGEFVRLVYRNNLSRPVAVNVQGLQAPAELLGGVGKVLQPQQSWSPIIAIEQAPATCWYQGYSLTRCAYETYRGLAGMWLIEEPTTSKGLLPSQYGVNDIPLILQDLQLNNQGTQLFQPNQDVFLGNRLFVNGQQSPYLKVARGWVRLRIVNASLSRCYELSCDDGRDLHWIASDQGFFSASRAVKSLFLAPSERAEILLDLNEGGNVKLMAGRSANLWDKLTSLFSSEQNLLDNTVLELRPEGLLSVFSQQPNIPFKPDLALPSAISQQRQFHINNASAMINQRRFDPRRIDVNAKLGSLERWQVSADSPVGFRLQGARFIIESIDNQPLPLEQQSWKDTVWVDKSVQLLVHFTHPSSHNFPLTFGSSDLMLADKGAMGLMVVQ